MYGHPSNVALVISLLSKLVYKYWDVWTILLKLKDHRQKIWGRKAIREKASKEKQGPDIR